jgi:hypothetical protein
MLLEPGSLRLQLSGLVMRSDTGVADSLAVRGNLTAYLARNVSYG